MATDDDLLKDDEIQQLLAQAGRITPPPAAPSKPAAAPAPPPASSNLIGMDEIESLLQNAGAPAAAPKPASPSKTPAAAAQKPSASSRTDQLLRTVEAGLDAVLSEDRRGRRSVVSDLDDATPFAFEDLKSTSTSKGRSLSLGALDDVELDLHIELGRAELLIDEVLGLEEGSVVPLDKLAGDPVDIVVNGRLLARGEVLVLNDNFCVRIGEIVSPDF